LRLGMHNIGLQITVQYDRPKSSIFEGIER
jgi:hypothetical protein